MVLLAAIALASVEPAWKEVSRGDGVIVYRKEVPGSPVMAYKGEAVVDAPVSRIMAVIKDTRRRPEWAERVEKAEVVRELGPCERIEYMQADAPWPVKDRDVVYDLKIEYDLKKGEVKARARSVDDASHPPGDKFVRAFIYSGDFTLTPLDGGKRTKVEAEVHGDPKGSIPKWVVDMVQKRAPRRSLKNLVAQLRKNDIGDDAPTARFVEWLRHPDPKAARQLQCAAPADRGL